MLAVPLVLAKSRVHPAVNDLAPPNILANHIVPGFETSFNFVTNFMFEAHFERQTLTLTFISIINLKSHIKLTCMSLECEPGNCTDTGSPGRFEDPAAKIIPTTTDYK